MISKNYIERPDWCVELPDKDIDLSKNVHYDHNLNENLKELIRNKQKFIINYANDYKLYKAISDYYKIKIKNIAIGFGATDLIQRTIFSLNIKKLYIVKSAFMMVDVYCKMINLDFEFIDLEDLKNKKPDNESAVYIANPNGVDGNCFDVSFLVKKFKYIISDEVYSDFFDKFSLIADKSENVIIIKSLSKSLGVAGLRIGFCHASLSIIKEIQKLRMSQIATSISSITVPEIIKMTPAVISRMKQSKDFLEKNYKCKKSYANYVLFEKENIYTKFFGCRKIGGYYRMALADMETLKLAK